MIAGWCPVRAFKCRKARGPVDWLLLACVALLSGYAFMAAVDLVCRLGGW